ncbi:MAG TPA: hypothetical protein VMT68_01795 [Caulobacteraceae bacterium]|nr:hypothetical protein [Caulobacteraceae bacterium]
MQLAPGLVIAVADPRVRPRNRVKWHICVCPERRRFLRINSKPLWTPWHFIEVTKNPFLDHDSHVELTALHFFAESELRGATIVGQMPQGEQVNLAYAAQNADTLNEDEKDLIWERLGLGG